MPAPNSNCTSPGSWKQGSAKAIFADDTTLLSRGRPPDNTEGLEQAKQWFYANKLVLNESKTARILFSSERLEARSEPVRLLGVVLDTRLNWSHQVDYVCARLSSQLFVLRRIRPFLDGGTLRTVYFSIVHSHLTYGTLLWGNSVRSHRAFVMQKAAVRIIEGVPYNTPCRPFFKKNRILPLPCIFIHDTLLYIHKNIFKFTTHANIHTYDTRYATDLAVPRSRIRMAAVNKPLVDMYNTFLRYHRIVEIHAMNVYQFSRFVKKFLLTECFYSVNEFYTHISRR
ncbi:unnamed protein product [Callosobruchus maculatus]|uniref:Reverse transcriptase domain-containing protein n=1 Tax=Callosobruchus maculatus TaxID=64391 RepID=A0A653D0Z1_CALMS|nr:unnamed protein product [Callosobruchus maculatus]